MSESADVRGDSSGRGRTRTSAGTPALEAGFPGVVAGRAGAGGEPTGSHGVAPGPEPPNLVRNATSQAHPAPADSETVAMGPAICEVTRPPGGSALRATVAPCQ